MYNLIRIYKDNPTEGATDGTEVSTAGTFTDPITFRLDAEQNEISTIKLAIRTAEGYKTSGTVTIADRNDVDDHLQFCWTENGTFTDSISTNDVITSVNKIFYARMISHSSEYPTVDRKVSIQVGISRSGAIDTTNLIAYLPFDTSTTEDLCGNMWTTSGTPTIANAALQLDGSSYLKMAETFNFTGQSFTVRCKFSGTSNTTGGSVCLWQMHIGNANRIQVDIETSGRLNLWKDSDNTVYIQTAESVLDGQIHHAECDFDGATWYLFLDGVLIGSKAHTCTARDYTLYIGTNYQTNKKFTGTIDEFMIFDGVALHTENFTPPTDSDYAVLKALSVKVDQYLSFTGNEGCYAELPLDVLAGATTFTIEAKFSTMSTKNSSNNWQWGTIAGREIGGNWNDDFGLCVNDGKLCFWAESKTQGTNNTTSNAIVNDGAIHKVAVVSSNGAIDLYCDDVNVAHTDNVNAKITDAKTILLAYNSDSNSYLQIDLHELRFWNTARTEIFTEIDGTEEGLQGWYLPSSDGLKDYSSNERHATLYGSPAYTELTRLPVTVPFDVERTVINASLTWRYENAGDGADMLTNVTSLNVDKAKSLTGKAFYQTQRQKCFDVPAAPEVWIKFDVYFNGTNRWRAYNGGANGTTGLTAQTNGNLSFFANGSEVKESTGICKNNQLQTVLLHMTANSSDGVIEAWVDGNFIYRYTGDVNHGEDFADLYLQSDGAGTLFSNITVADTEVHLYEGMNSTEFNLETQISHGLRGWQYSNPGDADLLATSGGTTVNVSYDKSVTGKAFYGGQYADMFYTPDLQEVWIQLDIWIPDYNYNYHNFYIGNESSKSGFSGIRYSYPSSYLSLRSNGEQAKLYVIHDALNHITLHIKSGELIEMTANGSTVSWSGNVNGGEPLNNIFTMSYASDILFSNVVVSSVEINSACGWHRELFSLETEVTAPVLNVRWQGENHQFYPTTKRTTPALTLRVGDKNFYAPIVNNNNALASAVKLLLDDTARAITN